MIARRRFLRLLGLGTASAPLAAKQAEAEMMSLTSLRGHGATPLGLGAAGPPSFSDGGMETPQLKMADYLHLWGKLPRHVERRVQQDSRYVVCLDPDLAAKRSWSMPVRIAEQRQRNYAAAINGYKQNADYERAQVAFKKLVGFRWPW